MTEVLKNVIIRCHNSGLGYAPIVKDIGLTKDAMSAFCRRNGLVGTWWGKCRNTTRQSQTEVEAKKLRPSECKMTTPLFRLCCVQLGISIVTLICLRLGWSTICLLRAGTMTINTGRLLFRWILMILLNA